MAKCKYHEICGLEAEVDPAADALCILHSTNPSKSSDRFANALHQHRQDGRRSFERMFFSKDFNFAGENLSRISDFSYVVFAGTVNFGSATFGGTTKFIGVKFKDQCIFESANFVAADFSGTTFAGDSHFKNARFENAAIFTNVSFLTNADFASTQLGKNASFQGAHFHGAAEFQRATSSDSASFNLTLFDGAAHFMAARFSGKVDFSGAVFSHSPDYTGTAFREGLFSRAQFKDGACFLNVHSQGLQDFGNILSHARLTFSGATLSKGLNLNEATLTELPDFRGTKCTPPLKCEKVTFTEQVRFLEPVHKDPAHFVNCKFQKGVIFARVTFEAAVNFSEATFLGNADFNNVQFIEAPDFSKSVFIATADFQAAKFSKGAMFYDAVFQGPTANFHSSVFLGRTLFWPRNKEHHDSDLMFKGVEVDFREVLIQPPDAISFRDVDLSKCRFLDTDLRSVELTGVVWSRIHSRDAVYDEISPLPKTETRPWARIERLYRELKQNYEDHRAYERAGDFHYGEKEMRRQHPRISRFHRFLLCLYWLVSGYGERALRPLIWAIGLLVVSAFCYLFFGISHLKNGPPLSLLNGADWLRVIHYGFRVMTLLKPDDLVPLGLAKVINTVQSVFGPILFGLFALAVRQRLKR